MLLSRLLVVLSIAVLHQAHSSVSCELVLDVVAPLKQLVSFLLDHLTLSVAATRWAGIAIGNSVATSQSHGELVIAAILSDQLAIGRVKTCCVPSNFIIAGTEAGRVDCAGVLSDGALGMEVLWILTWPVLLVKLDLTRVVYDVIASLGGLIASMSVVSHILNTRWQYMHILNLFKRLHQQITGVSGNLDRHLAVRIATMVRRFLVARGWQGRKLV